MSDKEPLDDRATLPGYERQAEALFAALQGGDVDAGWRFKWEHPRFRNAPLSGVRTATLVLSDARTVVAREYGFADWDDLAAFTRAVKDDPRVARFEAAVEAVIAGDLDTLRSMLDETPALVHERSARRHHATLLHYIAANGVEGSRQRTPPNAVAVAKLLLERGAEVDALADMYDARCTTMSMLVSSSPPANAGVQAELAEVLLDHGAALEGPGSAWQSAVMTALVFGFVDTAKRLAARGAVLHVGAAAALGKVEDVARLLPEADALGRHIALALAAQHGQTAVIRLLLDAGEDPDRYNPDGFHSHATPLHQAIWSDREDAVRLLVERGARLDLQDTIYQGTPLDWAVYGKRAEIADYLRDRGAPGTF